MGRHQQHPVILHRDRHATHLRDGPAFTGQREIGGRSQGHHDARPDDLDFLRHPPPTMSNLAGIGTHVNAPLATPLVFEMLDRIRDIDL